MQSIIKVGQMVLADDISAHEDGATSQRQTEFVLAKSNSESPPLEADQYSTISTSTKLFVKQKEYLKQKEQEEFEQFQGQQKQKTQSDIKPKDSKIQQEEKKCQSLIVVKSPQQNYE